ncbi:MAG TPA: toluene tolerance protein, partial [Methylophaga sp.]|nr:toluene tolerance protein [Methylophaga sp.]
MLNIRPLSRERLASLMENAAVIEADKKGIKVAVLPDGQY